MNRKERRAARSTGRSPARAGASSAQLAAELFNTAVMHHHAGALADAERGYRQLLAAFPGHAEAHSRLGAVLMRQGRSADAIAQIERALALQADVFEAYGNLAQAYLAAGQIDRATEAACRALELNETPQTRAMFAQCVAAAQFGSNASRYRRWLARALVEGWTRPRELTRAAIALIKRSATIADAITRVNAVWPQRLAPPDLSDSAIIPALAADDLLCRLLESDPIADLGLEPLLTSVRGALLQRASDQACDERLLGFVCSLARQCFINEYVFATTDAETRAVEELRASLPAMLAAGKTPPAHWLPIIGAYVPLHSLANPDSLLTQSWPQPLEPLITQQIREPAEEARIAAGIPALTAIDDEVSRAVRRQYEENPYPRWTLNGTPQASAAAPATRRADCRLRHRPFHRRICPPGAWNAHTRHRSEPRQPALRQADGRPARACQCGVRPRRYSAAWRARPPIRLHRCFGRATPLGRSIAGLAHLAVAIAPGRHHAGRPVQRTGPPQHRCRPRVDRRARLSADRRRYPALPPGRGRRRGCASRLGGATRRLFHLERMPRSVVSRAGAPHDGAGDQIVFGGERTGVRRILY